MLKSSLFLSLVAIVILLIIAIPSQYIFNNPGFQQELNAFIPSGIKGTVVLFLCFALLSSIGLPRQISAFTCGYSLGLTEGVIIATLAVTLGCYLTVLFSSRFLQKLVLNKYPKQQSVIVNFLSEQLIYKATIIRILPLGSNFLTNIIAGACKLNHQQFVLGSFIGFIPQMIIFTLAGTGIRLANNTHIIASITLFVIAAALSLWLYKRHKSTPHNTATVKKL